MSDFYQRLRKAELHVHLEGSVEPETVLELDPNLADSEVRSRYRHSDFAGFIQSYIWINRQLRTPEHYGLITRRLLERLERDNVEYVEIILSAGVILWKEQNFHAIFDAVRTEAERFSIDVFWILDAVRHFGVEPAVRVAELAIEYCEEGVVGFGIGGNENTGPAGWFRDIFSQIRDQGLAILPHAGETVGPDSVWSCVNMGATRIGHGFRSAEDPELMEHLREHNIPLEICLTSNVRTGSVASIEEHPVRKLFDAGVPITLNTDDPALFGTSLSQEYRLAAEQFGFTEDELRIVAGNGFRYRLG